MHVGSYADGIAGMKLQEQGRQGKVPVSAACFRHNYAGRKKQTGILPDSGKGRRGGLRSRMPLRIMRKGSAAGIDSDLWKQAMVTEKRGKGKKRGKRHEDIFTD